MIINKSQDIYEISDTFKNEDVVGQGSVGVNGNIIINVTIGEDPVFYNLFPNQDSCGINATVKQFDPDVIQYLTDLAGAILNLKQS